MSSEDSVLAFCGRQIGQIYDCLEDGKTERRHCKGVNNTFAVPPFSLAIFQAS